MKQTSTSSNIRFLITVSILAAASGLAADYPTTVTSLGPVGYYRLGEMTPVAGNIASNSGTAGPIGNGFYVRDVDPLAPMHPVSPGALVGSGDTAATFNPGFMQVPFDASINPQGAFTAEIWVQPTVAPAGLTCAMAYGHLENPAYAPNRSGWLLYQDNGASAGGHGFQFRMYNHILINRSLTLSGGVVPNVGEWYHVVVAYDGTNGYLYVNGVLEASGASPGFVASVDGNFSLGVRNDRAFNYSGWLDEVAVYTNALSAADVLAHYQNGTNAAPATPYNLLVQIKNPLLYYRLNEPAFTPTATPPTSVNLGSWGAAQNAVLEDGLTMGQPGVPFAGFGAGNLAPHFNGLDGTVIITNPPLNTATLTFTAWVKREGPTDGGSQGIYGSGWAAMVFQRGRAPSTTAATGFGFGDAGNDLRYHWENAEFGFKPTPSMVLADRVWNFVAVVFNTNQTVLCLNGVFATNVVAHTAHDFSADPLYIGRDPVTDLGDRVVHGFIDEVAIFDKALTPAQLLVLNSAGTPPPVITSQPVGPGGIIYEGFNISLSVAAVGPQLTYQWTKGGNNLSGQTTATFAKNNVLALDSGAYAVVVANSFGSVTSSIVNLTILAGPPNLTSVPASVSVFPGGTAKFGATAVGSTPITYQWYFNTNTLIPGATSSTLVIPLIQAGDVGTYSVRATNPNGNTNSPPATLTILPATPNYIAAILTRSPIAYWRLNETNGSTAFDSEGSLDGSYNILTTLNNSPGPKPAAFQGLESGNTAYSFNGNTSDILAPPLNVNNNAATVVLFLQPQGLPSTDYSGLLVTRGTGSELEGFVTRTGGNLGYYWNNDPLSFNWDSTLAPVPDQWNFAALVVEPGQATIYLYSGAGPMQTAVNAIPHGPAAWAAATHLGTDPSGNRIYHGLLDEVAVFNYALSPADIQAIRDAAYLGTFTPAPPQVVLQPVSQTALAGDSITLRSAGSGTQPLSYQWTKNGTNVPGAIRGTLSFPSSTPSDSGTYRFLVTQGITTVTSTPAILNVLSIPSYSNLTNQLVLHLRFDGDYSDTSGRSNNASAPTNSPPFLAGKLGQGVHIGASTPGQNYLVVSDLASDLAFEAIDSFTVSFWVNYTSRFNDVPIIGNAVNSTYQLGWVFTDQGGKIEYSLVSTANSGAYVADPVAGSPVIGNGAWHNVVGVVDRTNELSKVFVDGALAGSLSIVGLGTLNYATAVTIGQDPTGNYGTAIFDLDDLGIWRKALTDIDARSIYFAGQSGHSFDTPAPPSVTLAISKTAGNLQIQWSSGTLESSDRVDGGFGIVPGASAPSYTVPLPVSGSRYYRVKVQ